MTAAQNPAVHPVHTLLQLGRVLIVVGKGGVGKTTLVAALAHAAADLGRRVLVIDVEGRPVLSTRLGCGALGYEPIDVAPGIRARLLSPDRTLTEWMNTHGLRRLAGRLATAGALDVIATATPGMKDILVLGKVKQMANDDPDELIIVDAPASGHALQFLTSPSGLLDAVRTGPIRAQAEQVVELLTDPSRCQAVLVTLPEATPIQEAVETAFALEDRVDVALGPIVVNQVAPALPALGLRSAWRDAGIRATPQQVRALEAAYRFLRERRSAHDEQLARLAAMLPLATVCLPELASAVLGPPEVALLAQLLVAPVHQGTA